MSKRTLLAVGLSMAMLGPACANAGSGSASGTPSPPTPTATSPSPTGQPSPSPALEDGRHFGFIESVDIRTLPGTMVFDLALFLTGDEANQAAAEHGDETPVPNDYYIVNDNPRLRSLVVSSDIRILLLDWRHCCDRLFPADPDRFQDSFSLTKYPAGNYKGKFSTYWVTVNGGVVTAIGEQYLP
jgi:hypothetical protein